MTIDGHIEFLEREVKEYTSLLEENNGTYIDYQVWTQSKYECEQLAKWLKEYKELILAVGEIKSLSQSRQILLMKGDEVLDLVKDIIDKRTSGKEDV